MIDAGAAMNEMIIFVWQDSHMFLFVCPAWSTYLDYLSYSMISGLKLVCALGLLPLLLGLAVTPQFEVTSAKMQTATVSLNTASLYGVPTADTLNQVYFTATFSSVLPTTYSAVTSLTSLEYDIGSDYLINVTTNICAFYNNGIKICVLSRSLSQLKKLSARYLAIDDPRYKIYHFYYAAKYYVQNQGTTSFSSSSPITSDFTVASGLNTTGTLRAFALLTGFNATSGISYLFDLTLTASYTPLNKFRVVHSSGSTTTIQLSSIQYCLIGYNEEESQSWPFPAIRITFGPFSLSSPFTLNSTLLEEYNTFWGLTSFQISTDSYIKFDSTMTPSTSISTSTTNTHSPVYSWMGFLFEIKDCNTTVPYFMIAEDLCYDICPNRYYESTVQNTCQNCTNFDCLKCLSNGTCTSCDNTTEHRQLAPNGRCEPVDGYYESNVAVALPCDGSCRTCDAGTASDCTGCFDGYYLGAGSCVPCMANCSICLNATYCSSCNNSLVSDGSGGCTYPYDCPSIADCQSCDPFTGCSACFSGYNLTNASSCSGICGDGIFISVSQECDDNNTLNNDGCSSTCTIEVGFYCINNNGSMSSCYACPTGCSNCTNATSCDSCLSGFFMVTNLTQQSCSANCSTISFCQSCTFDNSSVLICLNCSAGYTVVNSSCGPLCGDNLLLVGEECDDGNLLSGDGCDPFCKIEANFICITVVNSSVCSECLGATYPASNKSACLPCANYDCSKCQSTGNCTYCDATTNRYLDNVTERCLPNSGYYDDGSNTVALPCQSSCLTCNGGNSTDCLSCDVGRVLENSTCLLCTVAVGVGCSKCQTSGTNFTCTECQGSTLQNGACVFSQPSAEVQLPEAPSLLPIILGAVGGALLCCCCWLLFCCWRRRKNQENKVAEEQGENEVVIQSNQPEGVADPFDEKLLTHNKKKKYRGDNKPEKEIKKKRRTRIIQDTEENQLSMEEFKETLPVIPKKKVKEPFEELPQETKKMPLSGGPLIISQIEGDPEAEVEPDIEEVSQKHVVGGGFEELPPEPKKEEVLQSSQKSEFQNSDIFKSEVSDDFGSDKGR